jgi:hypothetical protein
MMMAQVIHTIIRKITLKNTSNKKAITYRANLKILSIILSACYCVAAVVAATALLLLHCCKARNITEKTTQKELT